MATITCIQAALLCATRTGSAELLNQILDDIALAQVALLSKDTLQQSYDNLSNLPHTPMAELAIQSFMDMFGPYLPGQQHAIAC